MSGTAFRVWLGSEEALAKLDALEQRFFGEVPEKLAFQGNPDAPRDSTWNVSADRKGLYMLERVGDVAIVKAHGSLTNTYQWWHPYVAGDVASYEAIADALHIAAEEPGVNRIIMDIASGGGVVRGLDIMSNTIRRIDGVKPVLAHTDSHMFSAAFWMGVSARQTTAARMAEVGSIGTLMVLPNYAKAAEQAGVTYHVFRAGEFKALGLPYEELSDAAKAHIQDNLEKTNTFFLEHVSRSRNLFVSDRAKWAEGKTFFAEEGLAVGLIDRVTTLADLIGSAASQPKTSDQRRFEMNISEEKLAQIMAGADPKTVLTAEELEHYLAANQPSTAPVEEPAAAPAAAAEPAAAEPVAAAGDTASLHKEIGRLEVRLEQAQAQIEALEKDKQAAASEASSLMTVAQFAVTNLQTALAMPKEAKTSAPEILAQFNELQELRAQRFKTGQQTQTPTADTTRPAATTSFRH